METQRIVIAGGSGFLGRMLAKWYRRRHVDIVVLSRQPEAIASARVVYWDGRNLGDWVGELEGITALINLAGRAVNCRYHRRNRRAMMASRVDSTRVLGEAVRQCAHPPEVWLNASTATIYKHTYGPAWDESGRIGATAEAKDAFSIEVATAWERTFQACPTPQTRKVLLRAAMVFGIERGGVYAMLRRLTKLGLGGRMTHGRQWVSWIAGEDFCRVVDWLIDNPQAAGSYNLCSPHPLTNREMMATIRQTHQRRFGLPAARWMLEIGAFFLRTETELIIKSRRVIPGRLQAEGFTFLHPHLEDALTAIERSE